MTWIDDPDSQVKIIKTAWEDVKGLWRVRRGFREGRYAHLKRAVPAGKFGARLMAVMSQGELCVKHRVCLRFEDDLQIHAVSVQVEPVTEGNRAVSGQIQPVRVSG